MLIKYVHDKKEKWDDYLDTCIYAYNTVHEATSFSPFGRKTVLPVELEMEERDVNVVLEQYELLTDQRLKILQSAQENILRMQEKQKEIYDRKHSCPCSFLAG